MSTTSTTIRKAQYEQISTNSPMTTTFDFLFFSLRCLPHASWGPRKLPERDFARTQDWRQVPDYIALSSNDESERLIRSGQSFFNFKYRMQEFITTNETDTKAAIAYNEEFFFWLFEKYNLETFTLIHYGSWCKRDNFLSFQDLVVASKR